MIKLIISALLLAVVFTLGRSYRNKHVQNFDKTIEDHARKIPDSAGMFLTILGYLTRPLFLGIIASFVFVSIWILESHSKNIYLLEMIAGMGTIELAKLFFRRPRRDDPNVLKHGINSYSFPSGHAGSSLLFALVMSTLYPMPLLIIILVVGAFCVGVSRVYIRVHYPSDVIGGWCMAVAIYGILLFIGMR